MKDGDVMRILAAWGGRAWGPILVLMRAMAASAGESLAAGVRNPVPEVVQLKVESLRAPVEVHDLLAPMLRWQVKGLEQRAYQIQVAESPRALAGGRAGLRWDSGKVQETMQWLPYQGPALRPGWGYWWRVRVWGAEAATGWSVPVHFGTAPADWSSAKPIWAPVHGASTEPDWAFLRQDLKLAPKPIAWAHLFATAASAQPARQYVYKLWLNGKFVGLGPTQSLGDEARYDGFDVTAMLKPGTANTIGALAYTKRDKRFLAQLIVRFQDGTLQSFGTDGAWQALDGIAALPEAGSIGTGHYAAPRENIDARAWPVGFAMSGFDASAWAPAHEKAAFAQLEPTLTAKVAEHIKLPVEVVEYLPGSYFIDYGRSWVGGLRLSLDGRPGQMLEIRYGEALSAPLTVKSPMATGNHYEEKWTLRTGPQQLESWGIKVFRYAQISGAPGGLKARDFAALAQIYPFPGGARFSSSSATLNSIWQLSRNTIEALNGNLYADSWTRERLPYEADAYLQQKAHLYLTGDPALGAYTFDYFSTRRTWPTEWPFYVILAQYELWHHSGDIAQLKRNYASLVNKLPAQWLDAATGLVRKESGSGGSAGKLDFDIVDWPVGERDGFVFSPENAVVNALAYRAYVNMAGIAQVAGHPGDAERFKAIAAGLRTAINRHFWEPEVKAYRDGISGAARSHFALQSTVWASAMGVPEPFEAEAAADYITSRAMACSVYCAGFLIEALYNGNRGAAAHALLTGTGERSWLNMIDKGAGATMEAWDVRFKPNTTYSHPWSASPAFAIPNGLFGIEPLAPGFTRFKIKPQPGPLAWGHILVPTVLGQIGVAFEVTGADTQMAIRVPYGSHATVHVPTVSYGQVYLDGMPAKSTAEPGFQRVESVGGGCHALGTRPLSAAMRASLAARICQQ